MTSLPSDFKAVLLLSIGDEVRELEWPMRGESLVATAAMSWEAASDDAITATCSGENHGVVIHKQEPENGAWRKYANGLVYGWAQEACLLLGGGRE